MQDLNYFAEVEPKVRYWASYRYLFGHPKCWNTILLLGVCILIPVVGQMVMTGWLLEVLVPRLNEKWPGWEGKAWYPEFTFDRFMQHLERGLWPTVVGLVVGVVALIPIYAVLFGGMFVIIGMRPDPALLVVMMVLLMLLFVGMIVALLLITVPLVLRAAMLRDFKAAFSWSWCRDFVSKMWKELLLEALFTGSTGTVLGIVGYACCVVGVYPAIALVMAAQWHLYFQVYRLYLSRGGTPLPAVGFPPALPQG